MEPSQPTWKQWLMLLIRSMSLVAALTAALIAIEPLLQGHVNWLQVLLTFAIVLVFVALHSATSLVQDPALRQVLNAILTELQQILQGQNALSTRLAALEKQAGPTGNPASTGVMQSVKSQYNQPPQG